MTSRTQSVLTALAVSAITLSAQKPPTAQPGAGKPMDAAAAVFELSNSMGILRSLQQQDWIITLEQWASGTMTVGTERYEIPEYRMSVNYAVPGMRVDFTRKSAAGKPERSILVVSGSSAWNESTPGVDSGTAPSSVKERLVQLWTTPMGVAKAARAAGANARVVAREPGTHELIFSLPPPVEDVTVTATIRTDSSLVHAHPMALKGLVGTYVVRVQTTGAVASDTTYAEYGDWNWSDYRADIFLPKRMTRKMGDSALELTTKNTNTYNPYVVMPVPERVKASLGQR
jgi:hypothetical protein